MTLQTNRARPPASGGHLEIPSELYSVDPAVRAFGKSPFMGDGYGGRLGGDGGQNCEKDS